VSSARSYDVQGIQLAVSSDAPAVIAALDRRLESLPSGGSRTPGLRLDFLVAEDGEHYRLAARPGPSRPVYETPHGEIAYDPKADTLYGELDGVRMVCHAAAGTARIESDDFSGRRLHLATHTLTTICLIELLRRRGRFNLHAACLVHEGRSVLLAGPSGSGKSTLAMGLARAGLAFLSDDMVYLERTADGVELLAFPDAVGLTEQSAERFPELQSLLGAPRPAGFPKHLITIRAALAVSQLWRCQPDTLIFPELVGGSGSELVALDAQDAWLRLVPDVLLTEPGTAQAHLGALAALLADVDCHVLRAGTDLRHSVELVCDLLRATRGR
jgi:hypothetical protein